MSIWCTVVSHIAALAVAAMLAAAPAFGAEQTPDFRRDFTFVVLPFSDTRRIVGLDGTEKTISDAMVNDFGVQFLPAMAVFDASGNIETIEPVGGDDPTEVASTLSTYMGH